MPTGFTAGPDVRGTRANFKALGFTGIDEQFGPSDATITFSTGFYFDFDNRDGVLPGHFDFETVAAHEIGHALGFVSSVDQVDALLDAGTTGVINPSILDLFRFEGGDSPANPQTTDDFLTFGRSLLPGGVTQLDQILEGFGGDAEVLLSTGVTQGDQQQASHLKDNRGLGLLDPTLGRGETVAISDNDLRVLDLLGYDIVVPEPATALLLAGRRLARGRAAVPAAAGLNCGRGCGRGCGRRRGREGAPFVEWGAMRTRRSNLEPRLELMPLLDVVFLLLTFFISSFVVMIRADTRGVTLAPVAGSAATTAPAGAVRLLVVQPDGELTFDGDDVPAGGLDGLLVDLAADPAGPTLYVSLAEAEPGAAGATGRGRCGGCCRRSTGRGCGTW